jgi:lipopolysaccharide cholinephosphotransferase
MNKKRIVLFGASLFGKKAFDYYSTQNNVTIVAFCDNDKKKHQTEYLGIDVISPEELAAIKYDAIVIASSYDNEIYQQLISLNISPDLINKFHSNQKNMQLGDGDKLLMAEEIMLKISSLFNEHNIEYHIDHGTLLGLIRDQSILPWDIDIDFAIPEYEKEHVIQVLDSNLSSYQSSYCTNNNWTYSITNHQMILGSEEKDLPMVIQIFNHAKDNLSELFALDIELKHRYIDKIYWKIGSRRLSSKTSLCFPATFMSFKDQEVKIPNKTELYLKTLYGNWKKPVKEWYYDKYENIT